MIQPARSIRSVLVTGGAGFIGSYLCDELLRCGYRVRVLDNLSEQVHGAGRQRPEYLADEVELMVGDVRDPDAVRRALRGVDAVFHLAAMVGVGQSMYEVHRYTSVNNDGTAVLLEALIERPVQRLVVASSMSIYGEGLYCAARTGAHGSLEPEAPATGARVVQKRFVAGSPGSTGNGNGRHRDNRTLYHGVTRTAEQLRRHQWEPIGPDGEPLEPVPTPETKQPNLASVYALSKYDQERMSLIVGQAYNIPTTALRFFNVYGPRQALSNPYTGVIAIFASRLLNGNAPLIFEDGQQQRDFVSVHDVARACRLALESPRAPGEVFNIGSGRRYTIRRLGEELARILDRPVEPEITGQYRVGDIRHCFADIGAARARLGYEPRVGLDEGMTELASWLEGRVAEDRVAEARAELANRGLTV